MRIDDAKLRGDLATASIAKKYRVAIEKEYNKMQSKGIFAQLTRGKNYSETNETSRALFGNDTFDRLGVPHEVITEQSEGLEI